MTVFDEAAVGFASDIEESISRNRYRRGSLFVEATKRRIENGASILDYGCGPGRMSALLAQVGYRVVGVDPSEGMISIANQQNLDGLEIQFRVLPPGATTLAGGPFQCIVCSSVIEYVPEPDALLRWFAGQLCLSGTLIISFANRSSLWRRWTKLRYRSGWDEARRRSWVWPEFLRLIGMAGFRVIEGPIYFEWPLDRYDRFATWPFGGPLGLVVAQLGGCRGEG